MKSKKNTTKKNKKSIINYKEDLTNEELKIIKHNLLINDKNIIILKMKFFYKVVLF